MKKFSIILLLTFAGISCKTEKADTEKTTNQDALTVRTALVSMHTFHDKVSSSGTLTSKSEIKLAFKTGGMIKKAYVNEGQYVKAGQLLAELDLSEIEAQVNQAKIGFEKSKRDFERVEKLFNDEAATKTSLNDAKSGLEIATQTLAAAQFNQKLSKIYAPASGRILMKLAEQGELITPFAPMFILGTGDQAYVVNVGLTDRDVVKISLGDPAEVVLDAYPQEIFMGKVTQIAPMITPTTGTYAVEVEIAPMGKKLISGFVARIDIETKKSSTSLVIPAESLVNAHGKYADVYIYSGGKAKKRKITLGGIQENFIRVVSGLEEGESVITLGSGFVSEGDSVTVNNK